MTLIANQTRDTVFMKILVKLCYPNWALEAFIIANAERSVLIISDFIIHLLMGSVEFLSECIHARTYENKCRHVCTHAHFLMRNCINFNSRLGTKLVCK